MAGEKELMEEIEAARKRLEEETKRKEKEADEKLDELLVKRKMEFCPACGRKIGSRSEWGGKCLHDGCGELICTACFASEEKRYCRKHGKDYAKKEEASEDYLRNLTLNYTDFVEGRMKKSGMDWTPKGFIRKTKTKMKKKRYGDFELMVYEKRTLSKKPRIRILVRPMTERYEEETNGVLENPEGEGIYTLLAFVGNPSSISQKAERFAAGFSNKKVSLFVMDMESGDLHFNANEKITGKYACWLDPAKAPMKFADLLKSISESVSGRKIVYVKAFAEELGTGRDEAAQILRESKLLDEVKGADSFIIRE
jgi:hypothetical protein